MSDCHRSLPDKMSISRALRITRGETVVCRDRLARVLCVDSPSRVLVQFAGTRDTAWVAVSDLRGSEEPDSLVRADYSTVTVDTPSEVDLQRAEKWVGLFGRHGPHRVLTAGDQALIANEMGTSVRTVARRFSIYLSDSSTHAQLNRKPGPALGGSNLSPAVEAVIAKVIEEKYESGNRANISRVVVDVHAEMRRLGLEEKPPSRTAVSARIHARPSWNAEVKRHGRVRGSAKAGPAGSPTVGYEVLEFVQMDHAIVDLVIVDPDSREPMGRPWITLAIDVASRCVLGFYLEMAPPSQTSVAMALEHACCPKDKWLKGLGCSKLNMPFGLMSTVGWDNGKSFRARGLQVACRLNGIEPKYRNVRTPTHGAHIERFIGTYMGKVHLLKGTTFSNTVERGDYNSDKQAVMTFHDLLEWTVYQIDAYHNSVHSSLGAPPLDVWNDHWRDDNGQCVIPPFPASRRDFRLSLLPGVYRHVTREGINRFSLKYWDDVLTPFIRDGKKYWVSHHPGDISVVYARLGDDVYDIPWRDRTRRPVSLYEWKIAKRRLKEKGYAQAREARVFESIEATRRIEEDASRLTRKQRRERQLRAPRNNVTQKDSGPPIDYGEKSKSSLSIQDYLK